MQIVNEVEAFLIEAVNGKKKHKSLIRYDKCIPEILILRICKTIWEFCQKLCQMSSMSPALIPFAKAFRLLLLFAICFSKHVHYFICTWQYRYHQLPQKEASRHCGGSKRTSETPCPKSAWTIAWFVTSIRTGSIKFLQNTLLVSSFLPMKIEENSLVSCHDVNGKGRRSPVTSCSDACVKQ